MVSFKKYLKTRQDLINGPGVGCNMDESLNDLLDNIDLNPSRGKPRRDTNVLHNEIIVSKLVSWLSIHLSLLSQSAM